MRDISIRSGSSEAKVSLDGAYLPRLSLDGTDVLKESEDGVQVHGGSAVLLPYAGRIRDGHYSFEGKDFELPVARDGHAIHGFAKDSRWKSIERSDESITLGSRLKAPGYPGVLEARMKYSIGRRSFSTECAVTNVGTRSCPFGVGFHPYFLARRWKILTTGSVYRYKLIDTYFPTGEKDAFSFAGTDEKTSLDDAFRVAGEIKLQTDGYTLGITRRRMPYLIVYNGKYAGEKSVAVEPYSGLEDSFNNGVGLTVLRPGESFSCGYKLRVLRP